jgi:hypothetical protein
MSYCPNCGAGTQKGKKFCSNCGYSLEDPVEEAGTLRLPDSNPLHLDQPSTPEEAGTLHLPESPEEADSEASSESEGTLRLPASETGPVLESKRPTSPVSQGTTGPANIPTEQPYYPPPVRYTTPPQPPAYQQPPPYYQQPPPYYQPPPERPARTVSLSEWLSGGWRIYKENAGILSLASFVSLLLSTMTIGILSGPLLMGLYRMVFKSMRGERPEMNDLFNWEGRFFQAFLVSIVSMAIYGGLAGAGSNSPFFVVVNFLVTPILTVLLGFTMPMLLDRKMDIAAAINEVGKQIFSRDALMWWIVGLVFAFLIPVGCIGCGVGFFVTFPWILCSAALGYARFFGFDDPNRTLN